MYRLVFKFLSYIALFVAVQRSASDSVDDSYRSDVCIESPTKLSLNGEQSLLQAVHKVDRRFNDTAWASSWLIRSTDKLAGPLNISAKSFLSESARVGINPSGAAAPLSEAGYLAVASRCCQAEMRQLIERQVFQLGLVICHNGWLSGITPYHSCEKGHQTFAKLTSDILQDSTEHCGGVARTGSCKDYPADCPQYSGSAEAHDCGCSRSKAAKMNFSSANLSENNLGSLGPTAGPQEFRIANAGRSDTGEVFDLVVTAISPYASLFPHYNGLYKGFAAINISPKTATFNGSVDLRFNVYRPGTYTALTLSEIHLAIFDLDGTTDSGGREFAQSNAYKGFVTDVSPNIIASILSDGRVQFRSEGTNNNIPNPKHPMELTDVQRRNSVMYFYVNTDVFDLTFGIDGASSGSGRYLFFAGESPLNDRCEP